MTANADGITPPTGDGVRTEGAHPTLGTPILRAQGLSKAFAAQRALDDVSFDVLPAEVHALVGHNGSGKSTFVKILAGYHEPDAGSVEIDGVAVPFGDPEATRRAGLRFIHQELGLVDDLTVLENLRLGTEWSTARGARIRWSREREAAAAATERVGLRVHPDVLASALSPVQRTQLAVARALQDEGGARILFFDEPTATLPGSEVDRLFAVIRGVVAHGISAVYISHRLEELPQIADRVTVLRDGKVVGSGPQPSFDRARLVDLIVGGEVQDRRAAPGRAGGGAAGSEIAPETLRFTEVAGGELVDASFAIRRGEVVGMAGLVGSGVGDVPALLLGRVAKASGQVHIEGDAVDELGPRALLARHAAVLPSARALKSILPLSVRENLTLPDLSPLWRGGRLRLRGERAEAAELMERFDVRPRQPERVLGELSGGNQQKVAVAKWLRTNPRLLVLDEPTQGVDIGGKEEILRLLRAAADDGVAVLICSSDVEDLTPVCDRVLIVRGGRIGTELTGSDLTTETIAQECYAQ
ncbi:MAG TPA: sugar ABC transporter ATP-binding protein [Baekduia sp.]|nr:sugar ABC transporter ATP-binding protein [Baekduia sp.]